VVYEELGIFPWRSTPRRRGAGKIWEDPKFFPIRSRRPGAPASRRRSQRDRSFSTCTLASL